MRPTDFLASLLLFSSATSAWPSGWENFNADIAGLIRRDQQEGQQYVRAETSYNLDYTGVQGNTATTKASTATQNGDSKSTGTGKDATITGTQTDGAKNATGTTQQTSKTFDARLPAGGVSMITPNVYTTSYFKINDYVTFAWNYTSLKVTPSYVDVLASCSLNQETYTIALNQSVKETQTVIWDTGAYQATGTVPLLTETYTLIIYDANSEVTARPQAGYLGVYDQFTFGMYTPQPYTPIADFVCATCNSAMTQMERQTMWAVFAMASVTIMSFGWFTGVAGLW